MGYTHYWTPKKSSPKKFKEFSDTCKRLYENLPETSKTAGGYYSGEKIEIGDGMGELSETNKPEFSETAVIFNGVGRNSHETFAIEHKDTKWAFCKTARKPYDLLVCACLIAAADILGYKLKSDGCYEDWHPAISFYKSNVKNTDKRKYIVNEGKLHAFNIVL